MFKTFERHFNNFSSCDKSVIENQNEFMYKNLKSACLFSLLEAPQFDDSLLKATLFLTKTSF